MSHFIRLSVVPVRRDVRCQVKCEKVTFMSDALIAAAEFHFVHLPSMPVITYGLWAALDDFLRDINNEM